jgi:hypothetical protein
MAVYSPFYESLRQRPAGREGGYQVRVPASPEKCCCVLREELQKAGTEGQYSSEVPCAICGVVWIVTSDASAEQGSKIAAAVTLAALKSGKVCTHAVGDEVNGEIVLDGAPCPCGKMRLALQVDPVED